MRPFLIARVTLEGAGVYRTEGLPCLFEGCARDILPGETFDLVGRGEGWLPQETAVWCPEHADYEGD